MTSGVRCVVQARMGSSRLPGKVLRDLAGRPMLRFLLDRLADLDVDEVVVATSDLASDDPVAEVAAATPGVGVVRGEEADVLARFVRVLHERPTATVVRLTADCPFTDPRLVEAVLARHRATGADYTSNVHPRTFPRGLDVEVVQADALEAAFDEAADSSEREHVTPFLYRRPERFRLANLRGAELLGDQRWTVDTADDLAFVQRIAAALPDVRAPWQEIRALAGDRSEAPAIGSTRLRLATADDSGLLLAWRNDPEAVRQSATARAVAPSEHEAWLARRLEDPATTLWVAEVDGEPAGTARVEVTGGIGEVSVAVAPERRGQGVGRSVLELVQHWARREAQVVGLEAVVRPDNEASQRAFRAIGFVEAGRRGDLHLLRWS